MHLQACSCTPWARPSPAPLSATTWPAGTTHCGHCRLVPSKLLHGGWPGVGGDIWKGGGTWTHYMPVCKGRFAVHYVCVCTCSRWAISILTAHLRVLTEVHQHSKYQVLHVVRTYLQQKHTLSGLERCYSAQTIGGPIGGPLTSSILVKLMSSE